MEKVHELRGEDMRSGITFGILKYRYLFVAYLLTVSARPWIVQAKVWLLREVVVLLSGPHHHTHDSESQVGVDIRLQTGSQRH
jgi:hypothetical protein